MPIGANLTFNFDTTGPQPGANQYHWYTEGAGPDPGPGPSAEFEFDCYSGASTAFGVAFSFEYNMWLCEYNPNQSPAEPLIIDFSVHCADAYMQHGSTAFVDVFTTSPSNQVNLSLCPYRVSNPNFLIFEYNYECTNDMPHGAAMEIDLWTTGRLLGQRVDLSLCCPYVVPDGHTTFEFSEDCNYYHVMASVCADADLTTTPRDGRVNDLSLCHGYKWVRPDYSVIELDTLGEGSDDLVTPVDNFEAYPWIYDFNPAEGCSLHGWGALAAHDSSIELDLEVVRTQNIDLTLCANELNPPLDYSEQEPHDFEFQASYPYICPQFELSAYHGAICDVIILKYVEFENVVGFNGSYSDLDFSTVAQFYPDGYGGAYADADMDISPAWETEFDYYSGGLAEGDLSILQVFHDIDAYSGGLAESDLDVPKGAELEAPVYNGGLGHIELLTIPVIRETDGYGGAYGDADLDISPVIPIDMDAYSGAYSDADMLATPGFLPNVYHGSYSDADMDISPSEGMGFFDSVYGAFSDADMAVTFALYAEAISGSIASFDIATTITLDLDMYGGEYGELDFSTFGPPLLESDNYAGSSTEASMNVTFAFNVRAYGGSYGDLELDTSPSEDLTLDFYGGALGAADAIQNDVWNFFCYEGAYSDAGLSPQVNFGNTEAYYGGYGEEFQLTMGFVAFDIDATFGSYGDLELSVPLGEPLEADAYAGATCFAIPYILIYHTFEAHAVHDLAMYDGVRGLGGLNHCYTEQLTCAAKYPPHCEIGEHEDSTIRFVFPLSQRWEEYDSELIINFDDDGFSPFNPCNFAHGSGKMEIELYTRPRMEVEFSNGATLSAFMKKELSSFGDVPLDVLYSEDGEGNRYDHTDKSFLNDIFEFQMYAGSSAQAWFNSAGDIFAWHGVGIVAELETVALWQEFASGAYATFDVLQTAKPLWREYFRPFYHDSKITLDFNPELWTRFCYGYIVPAGASVILDFGSSEEYDCFEYTAKHGASMQEFIMQNNVQGSSDNYHGHNTTCYLTTYDPWSLYARHGHKMWIPSEPDFSVVFHHGSNTYWSGFETHPILGYCGDAMAIDDLIVPGPGVAWITPSGCLPNEYVPLTPSGDPDLEALEPDEHGVYYWTGVPVELKNYFTTLVATCITYAQPDDE